MEQRRDDRSLGELFGDLTRSMSTLVRQEIELARTEMTSRASRISRDAAIGGLGGAFLYAALLGLHATIALGLIQMGVTPWLAALVVTVIAAVIGAVLLASAQAGLKKVDLAPRRTIQSVKDVKDDATWAKERMK